MPIDPRNHIGLVFRVAEQILGQLAQSGSGRGSKLEHLVAAGYLGLARAAERFDPEHGVAFSTFAFVHIRGAIWTDLHREGSLIRVPRPYREQWAEVDWAREQLRQRWGHEPTAAQLAAALDLTPAQLQELEAGRMTRAAAAELDRQAPALSAEAEAAQQEAQGRKRQLLDDLKTCLRALPLQHRVVVSLREREGLTGPKVAQVMRLSEDAVYRRQQQARAKIRACLEAAGWDAQAVGELLAVESPRETYNEALGRARVAAGEHDVPTRAPTPEAEAAQQEAQGRKRQLLEQWETCLRALPLHNRVALILDTRDGLTVPEIAQVMGESEDAIYERQQQARAEIRTCLEAAGWAAADIAALDRTGEA